MACVSLLLILLLFLGTIFALMLLLTRSRRRLVSAERPSTLSAVAVAVDPTSRERYRDLESGEMIECSSTTHKSAVDDGAGVGSALFTPSVRGKEYARSSAGT